MQETWVRSQSWEDPLQEEMATHSIILAWEIPWTEDAGGPTVPTWDPYWQMSQTQLTKQQLLPSHNKHNDSDIRKKQGKT